jgi:hypothetical protein
VSIMLGGMRDATQFASSLLNESSLRVAPGAAPDEQTTRVLPVFS